MTDTPLPTAADLERLLERVAAAEQDFGSAAGPLDTAHTAIALIDNYQALFALLRLRSVDAETGTTIGVTLAGLDIHVRDDGADWISICVNAEEATAGRDVRIESWDGTSWDYTLREEPT